jgi:hypothetical protein
LTLTAISPRWNLERHRIYPADTKMLYSNGFWRTLMKLRIALLFAFVLCLTGCADDQNLHMVKDADWDTVNKLHSGKFTLMSNDDLAALRHDAEIGKSVGRYRTEREGWRTWRLDTATGNVCLLLASEWDWEKPSIKLQGCAD